MHLLKEEGGDNQSPSFDHIISLHAHSQLPDEFGNAFVAQGIADGALDVKWLSESEVLISYPKSAKVFLNEPEIIVVDSLEAPKISIRYASK